MNKINGLVVVLIAIVIGVTLLGTIADVIVDYDLVDKSESFTAALDNTLTEDFTVSQTPETINTVTVNGTETTDYTLAGSTVTLGASASTAGDSVVVNYTYDSVDSLAIDSLISLMPLLFVILVVSMAVSYVRFK